MGSPNHKSARLRCSAIGGDIWLEIFKRLPLVTIGRCRCVCKEWRSLISSPLCVAAHHSFSAASISANRQPYLIYLHHHLYSRYRPQMFPLHVTDLRFPFRFPVTGPNFKVVDVINGVVCLSLSLLSHKRWDSMTLLLKFSGMLSVFYSRSRSTSGTNPRFEMWAMEEDSTWNKLFSINNIDIVSDFYGKVAMLSEDGYGLQGWLEWLALRDPNLSMTVNKRYRFYQPLNGYVYEESMFLMEDAKGKGGGKYYAKGEVVDIQKVLYPQIN